MLGRGVTVVAAVALALPATAGAAAPVVLTAPGGARLSVRDVKGAAQVAQHAPATVDRSTYATPFAFCAGVFAPGYAGPPGGCERLAPPTLDDPVQFTGLGDWIGGAVPAAAATVELVPDGGAPVRTPALAGDYHGVWAGRVKFFLAQLPGGPARRILAFDAAGALIGGETFSPDRVTGPSVRLGGGPLPAHQRWWARVRTEDIAAPAADAPDRHAPAACFRVGFRYRAHRGQRTLLGCSENSHAPAGALAVDPDCEAHRIALAALLPPGVRRAVLVLGDGRERALAGRRLPARFGADRYGVAAVLNRRVAIRAIRAGGRVRHLGQSPAMTACSSDRLAPTRLDGTGIPTGFAGESDDLFPSPRTPVAEAQPVAGAPDLLAALRGDDVCAGIGGLPRAPDDCAPAPLRARETRFSGRGREVALVTAPTVQAVTLIDASTQKPLASAPTVPLGAGRAAVVTAPPGRRLLVARLLGPDGYPLADVGLAPVALGPPHTVSRGRGWVATATRVEVAAAIPGAVVPVATTCVQVTRGLSPDCLDDAPGTVHIAVTCSPRVVHVFGPGRAATLELADGRRRAATARHGGWHGLLHAHEALRAVRVAGKRVRLAVQPAAAQCGYRGTVVG